MSTTSHDLHDFMRGATKEMAREYERTRTRADEDPGTAGDQGEENWASLLRNLLPPALHVVTKGRILTVDGAAGPQVDVLVLHPAYPKSLRDKKLYLAAGVVAAFECKLTLKAAHVVECVRHGAAIQRLVPKRSGSPYQELFSPLVYGLLAHSHSWKGERSRPMENVENKLLAADLNHVLHPRETIDLLCVADLATWTTAKMSWIGPGMIPDWSEMAPIYGSTGSASTAYVGHPDPTSGSLGEFTPIGLAVKHLLKRIAWEDSSVRGLARYFELAMKFGTGRGRMRKWNSDIYSDSIRNRVTSGKLVNGVLWDEWSMAFG